VPRFYFGASDSSTAEFLIQTEGRSTHRRGISRTTTIARPKRVSEENYAESNRVPQRHSLPLLRMNGSCGVTWRFACEPTAAEKKSAVAGLKALKLDSFICVRAPRANRW